jgi:hypothetical protein
MSAENTNDVALAARLERIKKMTDELLRVQNDSANARQLAERISREIEAARASLKSSKPNV